VSACPSVCPHATTQLPPDGLLLQRTLGNFTKSAERIKIYLKSGKNMDTLHEDPNEFLTVPHFVLYSSDKSTQGLQEE
jgi:hypothetical protein